MSRKYLVPILLPADPTVALEAVTKQYVDARAGSEVEIGTSDPIGTNALAELWYDTDDDYAYGAAPTTVAGNALGVIAVGGTVTMPVNSAAPTAAAGVALTNPVTVTFLTGRRYRLSFAVASVYLSTGTSASVEFRVNDASNAAVGDCAIWFIANGSQITAPLNGGVIETFLDGDGTTKTVRAVICTQSPTSGHTATVYARPLRIEDVGPTSAPALPIPETYQSWTPMSPLLNGWTYFGAPQIPPAYRRIGDMVQVRGTIKNATPMGNNTTSNFFVMPVGFRPPYSNNLPAVQTGADSWGGAGYIAADSNGSLVVIRTGSTPTQPTLFTGFEAQFSVTP